MKSFAAMMALAAFTQTNVALARHTNKDNTSTSSTTDATSDPNRPEMCYGIALSDASDIGPYQAGVLMGLLEHQKLSGEQYAVSTGVSLGAINAFILASHTPEQIDEAAQMLESFWMDLAEISPYSSWSGGFLYGFFFEKGIYDISTMRAYIDETLGSREVKRHLNLAVTNVLNGQFEVFDETYATDDLMKLLYASVSFSGISPAIEFQDQLYFSGDSIYENDIASLINHCEAIGYKQDQIVIDAVISGKRDLPGFKAAKANAFQLFARSGELFRYYNHMHGIMRAKDGHPGINFRYLIGPSYDFPSKILPLDFTPSEARSLLTQGQRDAENAIYQLLYKTDEEIEKRVNSPYEMRYYNSDRQKKKEDAMRAHFTSFINAEKAKIEQAKNGNQSATDEIVDPFIQ